MRHVLSWLLCVAMVSCGSDSSSTGDTCPPNVKLAGNWSVHYESQGAEPSHQACDPLSDEGVSLNDDGLRMPIADCDVASSQATDACRRDVDQGCHLGTDYETHRGTLRVVTENRLEQNMDYLVISHDGASTALCWSKYKAIYTR